MKEIKLKRILKLSKQPKESFFLWGPRLAGKSSLLKELYPDSYYIDLLMTSEYLKYLEKPWLLREELLLFIEDKKLDLNKPVVIDEIQRVPLLLDEVHWLIENKKLKFILCGSSVRKIKRTHANMLGGRALRYELFGLSAFELKKDFNLIRMINSGYIPKHYLSSESDILLESYVKNYLKEEIVDEALIRRIPAFSNFLNVASLSDTEVVNFTNIARDCGVSANTVKEYFQILEDTLLGRFIYSYTKRPKRRIIQAPKFYFFDVGVVNFLSKRNALEPGSELFGKAFENWVLHELSTYNSYNKKFWDITYWRLTSGVEVDFIVNNMECAIEAKASSNIHENHLKNLREIIKDHPNIKKRIIVSLVNKDRITNDKIHIIGVKSFVEKLWTGKLWD